MNMYIEDSREYNIYIEDSIKYSIENIYIYLIYVKHNIYIMNIIWYNEYIYIHRR